MPSSILYFPPKNNTNNQIDIRTSTTPEKANDLLFERIRYSKMIWSFRD